MMEEVLIFMFWFVVGYYFAKAFFDIADKIYKNLVGEKDGS